MDVNIGIGGYRNRPLGTFLGDLAVVAGILGALALFWTSVAPYIVFDGMVPGLSHAEEATNAGVSVFWSLMIVLLAILGGIFSRTEHVVLAWVIALLGTALVILGLFSIWLFVLPFAVLMVLTAIVLTTEKF